MKRNTVISIVIAALLCVVLLAMNPLSVGAQDSNRSTFSGNNNEGYSNPRKVTFIGSDYRKTLVVESGATVSNLPELPDPDEGTEWKWMIDGTDAGFTANTKVTADLTVTAVQRITNPVQDKDFMNGASGVIVNHVGGSTTHKEKHAALLSSFSSHKEANGKWLAAAVTEDVDVNRLTTWTFEFTGNCKENSNKDCYYYVRSSSGYLKVLPNNALTISNDNEPSQILVHKNNLNDPTFFLGDPDGKWWVNLKRDNPDCGFQSYDQMNDSTRLSFYTVPEKSFVTLSFDTNGGNRPAPDPIKAYAGDKVLSSTLPWNYSGTKNGHAFIGWAPNQSAVDPLYKNDEGETLSYEMPENGGTLYAVYDSDPILWLDPLNGENAVVCTNLSELTDLNKKPERDGYFFAGWAKNPFMPEIVDFDTFELDKDTTLFAVWKKYVTVTFHYAETTPVPKQFYEGQTIELDLLDGVTPVKEGWVYYQNNISSSATKPWTVPSGVDSIDLYEVKTVNITIDKNDGTTLIVIDNVKTGNSVSLVDYISTRENCKLEGWKADSEHNTLLGSDAVYTVGQQDDTLKAIWSYSVKFDIGSGRNGTKPADINATVDYNSVTPEGGDKFPSYDGKVNGKYDFVGWTTVPAANYNGEKIYKAGDSLFDENGGLIANTFYALYKVGVYFNLDSGSNLQNNTGYENISANELVVTPGETLNLGNVTAERMKRTLIGWAQGSSNRDRVKIDDNYTVPNTNSSLIAMWGSTITFDCNGFSVASCPPEPIVGYVHDMYIEEASGYLTTFTLQALPPISNHEFRGWTSSTDEYLAGKEYAFPKENMTLYAHYDGFVQIIFNTNGGSADDSLPQNWKRAYGGKITLPEYTGTKDGYEFAGWSRTSNLQQTTYYDVYNAGGSYTIPSHTDESQITFYAVWRQTQSDRWPAVKFGVRLTEGTFESREPSTLPQANEFTTNYGFNVGNVIYKNAVKEQRWVHDTRLTRESIPDPDVCYVTNDVTYAVAYLPTCDDIVRITQGAFDPENQFVFWYVLKYTGEPKIDINGNTCSNVDGENCFIPWHVDGTILNRNKYHLVYEIGDIDDYSDMAWQLPPSQEGLPDTDVTVGFDSGHPNNGSFDPYLISGKTNNHGYTFKGWLKEGDESGKLYHAGDPINLDDVVVTLVAQWEHDTKYLTVKKEWEEPGLTEEQAAGVNHGSVTLTLKKKGATDTDFVDTVSGYEAILLPYNDEWTFTTTEELAVRDENGESIEYKWVEADIPFGYYQSNNPDPVSGSDVDTTTITNTRRVVYVKVNDMTKIYGESDTSQAPFDFTKGKVYGDDGFDINKLTCDNYRRVKNGEKVGDYEITADCSYANDEYRVIVTNGKLTITPRPVTIKAKDMNKIYGEPDPTNWAWEVLPANGLTNGLIGSDTVTYTSISCEHDENVGTYTIKVTGEPTQGNYTVSYKNGTFTINPATAMVKADKKTKVYGQTDPELTAIVTGLVNGDKSDAIKWNTPTRESGQNVGTYTIKVTGGAIQGNYYVNYVDNVFEITPKQIIITAESDEKVYDGAPLTKNSIRNVELEYNDRIESWNVTGSRTIAGPSDNIPSDVVIVDGEGNPANSNYTITSYVNGTLKITQKPLTITAGSDAKIYDGSPLVKNSYTHTGLAAGDSIERVEINGTQTTVGSSSNVASNAVIRNAAGDDVTSSYDITYVDGLLEVTMNQNVIITAESDRKVYDGAALTKNTYTVSGLAEGHRMVSVSVTGSQTTAGSSANVPSDAVIVDENGADITANYTVNYVSGTLEVTKKSLSIIADNAVKVYDGTPLHKNSYQNTDLVTGDRIETVTISGGRTLVGVTTNEPSAAVIVNTAGEDVTSNYDISYVNGRLYVEPHPVTVTADSFRKEFGQMDQPFTAKVEGTLGSDTVEYELSREPGEEPGDYVITASGREIQGNYSVSYYPGTLTIEASTGAYTVVKVWDDDNNRDGVRPISLGVTLVGSDGTLIGRRLSDANNWTVTVTGLPGSRNGVPVSYSWIEESVDGYTGTSVVDDHVTTFTNTHEIARTSASVNKIWDDRDNAGGTRPSSLGVVLRGNGTTILGVTLNDENGWAAAANNLPLNENGAPISYVWYEQSVGGGYYAVSSTTSSGSTTLVNSNLYGITIHYRYADGTEAFADYTDRLGAGETFTFESPELEGYVVSQSSLVGLMPARDIEFTVIYSRAGQTVVTPTPTPIRTPETPVESEPEVPVKDLPEPRDVEPDEEHPVVVPVPNILVDIDDLGTALGLGDVFMNNGGYSLE